MDSLIKELRDRGFYLGGSRRMAEKYPNQIIISSDTDYDFCCDDTQENRQFLINNGFTKIEAEDRTYWDDLLVDIYKHTEYPIEVLVRASKSIYQDAFEALSAEVFMEKLWKSSPLTDPNMPKKFFRMKVCDYFNGMFRLHGYAGNKPSDLPF